MSITTVKANHCDVCGYEWLKTAKTPKRCANPGCRERDWDRPRIVSAAVTEAVERCVTEWRQSKKFGQSLPRDQQTRAHGIHHTPTCKCLACRAEGK